MFQYYLQKLSRSQQTPIQFSIITDIDHGFGVIACVLIFEDVPQFHARSLQRRLLLSQHPPFQIEVVVLSQCEQCRIWTWNE